MPRSCQDSPVVVVVGAAVVAAVVTAVVVGAIVVVLVNNLTDIPVLDATKFVHGVLKSLHSVLDEKYV